MTTSWGGPPQVHVSTILSGSWFCDDCEAWGSLSPGDDAPARQHNEATGHQVETVRVDRTTFSPWGPPCTGSPS